MPIDKTKPVYLKKIIPYGSNIFHPREYRPGELPEALLSEEFVSQIVESASSQAVGLREVVPMEITVTSPNTTPAKYPTDTVIVKPQEIIEKKAPSLTKVNINTASSEEIAKLPVVNSQAATVVLKEREKTLFKDVEDLQNRVPLSKGKWQDLADKISF